MTSLACDLGDGGWEEVDNWRYWGRKNIELGVRKHSSTKHGSDKCIGGKVEGVVTCRIESNITGLTKCSTTRGKEAAFYFMSLFNLSWCDSISTVDQR